MGGSLGWLGFSIFLAFSCSPKAAAEKPAETKWSDEESDVVHLTEESFEGFLSATPSVLVMFYAPWCGHCKKMKPDYVSAAGKLKAESVDGKLAAVDATEAKGLAQKFGIQGFPSLKYFKNGEFAWDFQERSLEKIVEFMKDPKEPPPPPPADVPWEEAPGDVVHLTADTFKSELKKKKHALVMFYAPWCGHCKAAKPEFTSAAGEFREEPRVLFGAVDCTVHRGICDQYEVRGFPTIAYFSYLKSKQDYAGGRSHADFVNFMTGALGEVKEEPKTEAPPPAQPPTAKPPEGGFDFDPAVRNLDARSFQEEVGKAARALVMFYAPWCGHCKRAKPQFSEGAAELKDGSKLMGAVDCTQHSAFCKEKEVRGYPTFQIYENGKFVEKYTGARDKASFLKALSPEAEKTEL